MKYTTETYIDELTKAHGNDYDYSNVEYIDSYHKVNVTCNSCGMNFDIDPLEFLKETQGHEHHCPKCNTVSIEQTLQTYLYKFKEYKIHNDRVTLTCPVHGKFDV